jgi:hypothetical protein
MFPSPDLRAVIVPECFARSHGVYSPTDICCRTAHSTDRNPLSYISRVEDAVVLAPSRRVHALSSFDLTFFLHNGREKVRLSLEPNHDIIAEGATIQYIGEDGSVHATEPIDRLDHRIFRGDAFLQHGGDNEWTKVGWARINVHRDGDRPVFEGALRIRGDHHHIQTSANYRQTMVDGDPQIPDEEDEYMVVWRDSDIIESSYGSGELKRGIQDTGCSSDDLLHNRDENNLAYRDMQSAGSSTAWYTTPRALFGRQIDGTTGSNGAGVNLTKTIGSTAGCPTTRKVALVGIAADCNYVLKFETQAAVRQNIIQQVNSASQVYESTFNISLGIQNLVVSNLTNSACPTSAPASAPWNSVCSDSVTITDRLNLFSKWRGASNDTNAYWTLLSTCNTGAAVGLAWLGEVCNQGAQTSTSGTTNETIAGANVVVRTSTEWQVIAHETGHTFGAVHDCTSTTCADGTVGKQQCCPLSSSTCDANGAYIMNPSTGSSITSFSPCSIGNICSFLSRNTASTGCLANNKDVTTITGSQCGNGIVESGEDCDCGGTSGCGSNSCCNPTTCKFTTNSVCDPANEECCTSSCRFASNGTVCRSSTGSCDPQETCSGTSAVCPADTYVADGTGCTSGSTTGLACASGQCTSRNLQCQVMMGGLTTDNDTYSCSTSGCLLSCASPEFGANTCYTMQQNFLDGTPCEGGGKCASGSCKGATLGNEISEFVTTNKNWIIPVACVVGGLLLIAFCCCIWSCCRKRRRPAPRRNPVPRGYGYAAAVVNRNSVGGRRPRGPASAPGASNPRVDGQGPPLMADVGAPPPYVGRGTPPGPSRTRSFRYA